MAGTVMVKRRHRYRILLSISVVCLAFSDAALTAVTLRQKTVEAWDEYVHLVESRISSELKSTQGFRAAEFLEPKLARSCQESLLGGDIFILNMRKIGKDAEFEVPGGRIHHWLGTMLIPGARTEDVIRWVQQYDRHKDFYDDVEDSRVLFKRDDFFRIFLRLKRKKIITVHYNTIHDIHHYPQGPGRLYSSSVATSIREIENPGQPDEKEKPEGKDNGFLWRLNSYWRYEQTREGVIVECESISLSRTVPALLFMIEGIVDSTAREALEYTLGNLRKGFLTSHPSTTIP